MPYIIQDPHGHQIYITNNPIIFMDCKFWGWEVESVRYTNKEYRGIQDREAKYGLRDKQERKLTKLWEEELEKRRVPAGTEVQDVGRVEVKVDAKGDGVKVEVEEVPSQETDSEGEVTGAADPSEELKNAQSGVLVRNQDVVVQVHPVTGKDGVDVMVTELDANTD